ncbi:MAG TPA: FAD binding domain-containing protein [Tepidisphaeraceae bacterium]|jgi:xanthine dehydrogenase small subunit
MRDYLIIYVNGKSYEIGGARAFQTLSNFLRYDIALTGTKVVCAEGDCGSCTVLIGQPDGESITYRPVTSCIQFLYQLDGTHIITIEGLHYDNQLNPIQQAMVRCHGAQCGFCTPGFVVSMCSLFNERRNLDERSLRAGLVGNLCRCTGYESILRAGLEVPRHELHRFDELYPTSQLLPQLTRAAGDPVRVEVQTSTARDLSPSPGTAGEGGGEGSSSPTTNRTFFKPTTIAQAVQFKSLNPTATPVAGATDIGVQVNKSIRDPQIILALTSIPELRTIALDNNTLSIGALATLGEIERRTEELCPEFAKMLWRHGSPLIRNAGTLGGNIANGSPIGDTMPALMVMSAEVELTGATGPRRVNMNDFYVGYRKSVLQPDEIITRVFMPLPKPGDIFRLYKLSKRHDLDISSFTAAFYMRLEDDVISDLRIAYGGVGPMIYRLRKTEAALKGKPFTPAEVDTAAEIALTEISPITDMRGSREYRLQLAANILKKFHAEVTGEHTYDRTTPPSRPTLNISRAGGNGNGKAV